jgi:hypothetical protein
VCFIEKLTARIRSTSTAPDHLKVNSSLAFNRQNFTFPHYNKLIKHMEVCRMSNSQTRAKSADLINLWNMIVSIVADVVILITFVPFFMQVAAISVTYGDSSAVPESVGLRLVSSMILGLSFAIIVGIATLVLHIITAVKNNEHDITKLYDGSGRGTATSVLSIVGIFFGGWIMAIIIYVLAHPTLRAATGVAEAATPATSEIDTSVAVEVDKSKEI